MKCLVLLIELLALQCIFPNNWDRSKRNFPGAGKTPIYRVWDRFQLGDCLVFLAFFYYAFHRELLNRLLLLAKINLAFWLSPFWARANSLSSTNSILPLVDQFL